MEGLRVWRMKGNRKGTKGEKRRRAASLERFAIVSVRAKLF
jgi:hypothetical protein